MANRIACTALTGRIVSGRVSKDGSNFVGVKADVTSDVLKAVIDKAEYHGGSFAVEGGEKRWVVTVTEGQPEIVRPAVGQSLDPTITLAYERDEYGTFRATMTISGLSTEDKAQKALDHMERLFCGQQLEPNA
ncbi:hypothetical protein [Variovorax paradoxus]|uniref:DUF7446 family protein n=1 Tax=Variovorax paradoxus TaxID=34073 RepID=UPI0019318BD7|nr:hypothetical protein INQ48_20675 [Variovorax paradoxus]